MSNSTIVEAGMLIRRPVSAVFEAFIDPAITSRFWFTKSSGRLETGKTIIWEWEMYAASATLSVKEIIINKKISIEWGSPATQVEFEFQELTNNTTYVLIRNWGFRQTGDALIEAVKDNTGGFTTVLDGLKAYLEYNIHLNLVADKFPDQLTKKWNHSHRDDNQT